MTGLQEIHQWVSICDGTLNAAFSEILTYWIDVMTQFDSNIMGVKDGLLGCKEDNAGGKWYRFV